MSDLSVFYVIDLSESMKGEKLDILNHTVEECNETLLELANEKNAELKVAMMTFSDGCDWITPHGAINDFVIDHFTNKDTKGDSNLKFALQELNNKLLDIKFYKNISTEDFLPIIIILTNKKNINNYEDTLNNTKTNIIYDESIKIAYEIGNDQNHELISFITNNKESLFTKNNKEFKNIVKIEYSENKDLVKSYIQENINIVNESTSNHDKELNKNICIIKDGKYEEIKKKIDNLILKEQYDEAYKLTNELGNEKDSYEMVILGTKYTEGKGVEKNYEEAFKYFKLSAEQENSLGQCLLGLCYLEGKGVVKNYEEAFKCFKLSASQGNSLGQCTLGSCFLRGIGTEQNYGEAFKFFKLSVDQGNVDALNRLGDMYFDGKGVKQDYEEAFRYYKLSSYKGSAEGQYKLGNMYLDGKGVEKNKEEGIKLIKSSANQGNVDALNELGDMYFDGKGIKQDYEEAFKYYKLSSGKGNAKGQYKLGKMYSDGKGVEKNEEEGRKLIQLSADQGYTEAIIVSNPLGCLLGLIYLVFSEFLKIFKK